MSPSIAEILMIVLFIECRLWSVLGFFGRGVCFRVLIGGLIWSYWSLINHFAGDLDSRCFSKLDHSIWQLLPLPPSPYKKMSGYFVSIAEKIARYPSKICIVCCRSSMIAYGPRRGGLWVWSSRFWGGERNVLLFCWGWCFGCVRKGTVRVGSSCCSELL